MCDREIKRYDAAGGVVVHEGKVLVLRRPSRGETRLPKGHVEPGETAEAAALRETCEESGYAGLEVVADLGTQEVTFWYRERRVRRTERYFLMAFRNSELHPGEGEGQFQPAWLDWPDALAALTFEAEREWVRRARAAVPVSAASTESEAD
jgi:8-oxo-dGTP pyrophosphatase MutT (NUDIX family)